MVINVNGKNKMIALINERFAWKIWRVNLNDTGLICLAVVSKRTRLKAKMPVKYKISAPLISGNRRFKLP